MYVYIYMCIENTKCIHDWQSTVTSKRKQRKTGAEGQLKEAQPNGEGPTVPDDKQE